MSLTDYVHSKKREYAEAPSLSAVSQAIEILTALAVNTELVEKEREAENRAQEELGALRERLAKNDNEIARFKEERQKSSDKDLWDRDNSNYWRDINYESRELREHLIRSEERDRGDRGPQFRRKMALVELSAQHAYIDEARKKTVPMVLCATFYAAAVGLIVTVILHQSKSIAIAAGWL